MSFGAGGIFHFHTFLLWIGKWSEKLRCFNEFHFVHVLFNLTELMRQLNSSKHNKRQDFLNLIGLNFKSACEIRKRVSYVAPLLEIGYDHLERYKVILQHAS